ncbi:hypothetical protein [Streptomyces cyaneofuscatus]|uniref:Uncharacterized protein n=1 Tax=Streptomyces cyaneofuscatus TaxID=66883 RepID=A0ABZ1EY42_9ACTN|nr:hypothetical protein [Streptomyces cyaneofuscatus]WSB09053.1 hypothetical protein OG849_18255 [Streptomyces cyaneofuscatus]WSD47413.1 hypothetical protein OG857_17150 [Streptomyces cyaneofuscatus]
MVSSTVLMEDGKHGGPPSDKPWTPPSEPKPSPDGSRPKFAPQS